MEPVFITGFMGAGKTTVGQALAGHLGLTVIDTDEWIESALGKPIKDIFAEEGEHAFRRYEADALKKVTRHDAVITTGGGIVMNEANRRWMKQHGTIIYLHCSPDRLFGRLRGDASRPLLENKNLQEISRLYEKRIPFYKEADETVDTSDKTVIQVVEEIKERLFNK